MQPMYPSLARAVETGPTAAFVSDFRRLPGCFVHMVETRCPAGDVGYTSRPELTLTQTLRAERPGSVRAASSMRRYVEGDFELAPAASAETWRSDGAAVFMNLALPIKATEGLTQLPEAGFGRLHEATFRCATLEVLVGQLWQSLSDQRTPSRLLAEGLYQAVVGQLLALSQSAPRPSVGGLDAAVMGKIDEMIAESCEVRLGLSDVAALAGMSVATFTRRFKATTGQSLHQYVLDQRIGRARQMLQNPGLSIATIAHRCGFSSQSHMTDVFRGRLGLSPGAYRRGLA